MNDQKVEVPAQLLQAIVNYLLDRPFRESAGLLQALQQVTQPNQPSAVQDVPPPAK